MSRTAYYNEFDPYCAQWLRNLIAVKLIAAGDVDERPIQEVKAADLKGYKQAHFFAGVGGWSIALRLAGWPDDQPVWTGSCPCQPFSSAGKRRALTDVRHLWPVWMELIAERAPPVVFGEQVEAAIRWGWIDEVFTSLETEDYACGQAVLPTNTVGGLHERKRVWWGAVHPNADRIGFKRFRGLRQEGAWSWQQFERLVQDQLQFSVPSGKLRALVDGVPSRTPKLRAYGNAIVPQVAVEFIDLMRAVINEARP